MICKNCGSQIDDKAVICVHCKKEVKKPFFKKPWFWVVAVIAALVVFVLVFGERVPDTPDPTAPTATTAPAQVDAIEISAEDLWLAYDQNSVGADEKYTGKTLKVTGDVRSIGEDVLGQTYITLDVGETLMSIQCYFEGDAIKGIIDLLEGDHVTLVGKCEGKTLNVTMEDCTIVTSSSSSPTTDDSQTTEPDELDVIEISAADLFAEYDDNAVAADAKYKGKKLKVTGIVSDIGTDILDQVYVSLDTGEYFFTIQCYFSDKDEESKVAQLSKGDEIAVLGTCEGMTLNVALKRCEIVG